MLRTFSKLNLRTDKLIARHLTPCLCIWPKLSFKIIIKCFIWKESKHLGGILGPDFDTASVY